jgi:ketosteroid isomerase-like protein
LSNATPTADRSAIERLLNDLYAARIAGELDRLCGYFAPLALFRIAGATDGRPITVEAHGERAIRSWLTVMVKTFRLSNHEILSMLIDADRAAVHWRACIHSKVTGVSVLTDFVDLIEVRAGLLASYREFFVSAGS